MKLISLFAGAGGEVLGAHRAGFEHVEVVEYMGDPCTTLELASGCGLFGRPSKAWSGPPLIVRRCKVEQWNPSRPADVWWASPPCQPDSDAGERLGEADPRDGWPPLWAAYDRAKAAGVAPTWLVCETVTGILSSSRTSRWDRILDAASDRFEQVDYWVLDAADYGVPQFRMRVILVCGPRAVDPPAPTHGTSGERAQRVSTYPGYKRHMYQDFDAPRPWVSMGEALGFRGSMDGGRNSANNPTQERPSPSTEPAPAPAVSTRGNQMVQVESPGPQGHLSQSMRDLDPDKPASTVSTAHSILTSPTIRCNGNRGDAEVRIIGGGHNPSKAGDTRRYLDLTDRPSTTVAATQIGNAGPFVTTKHDPALLDTPSPTVDASEVKGSTICDRSDGKPRENPASCRLHRATGRRRLTVEEVARLQDFPADWPFQGTQESRFRQVGNAVPPALAEAVLRQVEIAHNEAGEAP